MGSRTLRIRRPSDYRVVMVTQHRYRPILASLGAGALLVLAGCTVDSGLPISPTAQPTATPAPTASLTDPPKPSCSELTGENALTTWGPEVPPYWDGMAPDDLGNWDLETSDTSTYDPCADLSWIVLNIRGGTVSSPYHIMLFSHGEYIGTATPQAYGFFPTVERVSDDSLRVTYSWAKDGESNADRSGTSVSLFTRDAGSGEVVRTGDLPPSSDEQPTPTIDGAFPGAGGPIPDGATPVSSIRKAEQSYEMDVAIIVTPSGNIGCDVILDAASGCGVYSYFETQPYGRDELGPKWWIDLSATGQPQIHSRGDAPFYLWEGGVEAQVVPYGQAVHHGDFVCGSLESGLTCWNTKTGHGAFMNKDGYQAF